MNAVKNMSTIRAHSRSGTEASQSEPRAPTPLTLLLCATIPILCAVPWGAAAPLPLEDVVSNALAHSYAVRLADQEIRAAQAAKAQADTFALPVLSLQAQASRFEGLEDSALGPSIMIPAIEDRYAASVALSQPIFTGGRITGQRESATCRAAAAQDTRRAVESDAVLQAVAAYWNWSKAHYSVAALEVSVERMQSHAADMHTLLDAGMATENDVLATEVQLDQTRLGLAEGRRRVKLMRARIADITGRELPGDAVPVEASAPSGAPPPSEAELLDLAGAGRSERLALEKETASAEALARASRSDLYPQISLTARYEQARPNGLFFPPADEWNDEAFAGVSVNWQIFDWGRTQAASREAGARAAQARLRQAQVGEQIALEVREARINLADALEKAAVATRAQASAERNLEVATDLWKSGLARHSELLDAHARLAQAQREAVVARADVRLAEAALEHATGRTAERNIGGSE